MKLIRELIEDFSYVKELNESTGLKTLFIEGIFLQADIKNRNGRVYPLPIMEQEVNRYVSDKINNDTAYGELGHPSGPTINPDRISHRIVSLQKEGTNFIGKAKIGSQGLGILARGLIEDGGKLGVSSRGMGSLRESGGAMVVQGDFHLATAGDIVIDPSAPQAFVNGIMENVEWIYDESFGWKALTEAENIKKDVHENYSKMTEEDFLRHFENFLKTFK
jgi:hypothetical protein